MRYLKASIRLELKEIIFRINQKQSVTLYERILLSKYSSRFPHLNTLIKEKSLKFS
tara:strand:+ start:769 stop:936 length:168 start_codon:yes stop_codon:yes gene_type:complete